MPKPRTVPRPASQRPPHTTQHPEGPLLGFMLRSHHLHTFEQGAPHVRCGPGRTHVWSANSSGQKASGRWPPHAPLLRGPPTLAHQVSWPSPSLDPTEVGTDDSPPCPLQSPAQTGPARSRDWRALAGSEPRGWDGMNQPLLGVLGGLVGVTSNSASYLEVLPLPSGRILTPVQGSSPRCSPSGQAPLGALESRSILCTLSSTCLE